MNRVALNNSRMFFLRKNTAVTFSRRRNNNLREMINEKTIGEKEIGRIWALSFEKRWVETFIAFLLLVILSPILIIAAVAIKLDSDGPVFFLQKRTGYLGRRFSLIKFRTMVNNAEQIKCDLAHLNRHDANSPDFKIIDDPRITKVGKILRRYSIDEIPNFINVLMGNLRLVGPRPTSFDASTYNTENLVRLSVYPGITGLWQISGRSNVDFEKRVGLDEKYIRNQSMWQDLFILLCTPFAVFKGKGAC